jgi:7-cyano-7-deazaguanine synthase
MSTSSTTATVLMSGGIDSAACAHFLRSSGMSVDGLFIDHGQAAAEPEAKAVAALAGHLGIAVRKAGLMGSHSFGAGELLGRNAFLIFTALLLSGGRSGLLGLGLHAGTPYYDCSEAFSPTPTDRWQRLFRGRRAIAPRRSRRCLADDIICHVLGRRRE